MSGANGWIGVDLDGTLAMYDTWRGPGHIGEPIPKMRDRVLQWLAEGKTVKIFTARVWHPAIHTGGASEADMARWSEARQAKDAIAKWTLFHFGRELPATHSKDFGMIELWDDRCVRVIANTGEVCCHSSEVIETLRGQLKLYKERFGSLRD